MEKIREDSKEKFMRKQDKDFLALIQAIRKIPLCGSCRGPSDNGTHTCSSCRKGFWRLIPYPQDVE